MRHFFILFVFFCTVAFAQQSFGQSFIDPIFNSHDYQVADRNGPGTCRPDSIYSYSFSTPTDSVLTKKTIWHYADNDFVRYEYTGSSLQLNFVDSSVYDALNRLEFQQVKIFSPDSNKLLINYRFYIYWHGNAPIYDSTVTYYNNLGVIKPGTKTVVLLDANDQLKEEQSFIWEEATSTWQLNLNVVYTLTPTGKVAESESRTWVGTVSTPQSRQTYTYDSNDSLTLLYTARIIDDVPVFKTVFSYDPVEHREMRDFYNWDEVAQQFVSSGHGLYDADDQKRYERVEFLYALFNGGYTGNRTDYTYVNSSDCPLFTDEYVPTDGQSWNFTNRNYYFPVSTVATQEPASALTWSAYPNPAGDWIWLDAPAGSPVQMFDLQGQLLYAGISGGGERLSLATAQGAVLLVIGQGKMSTARLIQIIR